MGLREVFDRLRMSRKPTKEEKDKELDEVLKEHKVDFAVDNASDLRDPE